MARPVARKKVVKEKSRKLEKKKSRFRGSCLFIYLENAGN